MYDSSAANFINIFFGFYLTLSLPTATFYVSILLTLVFVM